MTVLRRTLTCATALVLVSHPVFSQALSNAAVTARPADVVQASAAVPISVSIRPDTVAMQGQANQKDPFIAGVFSFFIPGLGSMYAGNKTHGAIHLAVHIGAYALFMRSFVECLDDFYDDCSNASSTASAAVVVLVGNDIWSIFTAVHDARKHNGANTSGGRASGSLSVAPSVRPLGVKLRGMTRPTGLSLITWTF